VVRAIIGRIESHNAGRLRVVHVIEKQQLDARSRAGEEAEIDAGGADRRAQRRTPSKFCCIGHAR
jgi:hypothetical protein